MNKLDRLKLVDTLINKFQTKIINKLQYLYWVDTKLK